LRVTTVVRPNHPPDTPPALRSRISRSRVKPEMTSVSPSATRAIRSDSATAGVRTIGLSASVNNASPAICAVTLKVTASVRTMAGSLFNVSTRGVATVVTLPCSASNPSSVATSVVRRPVSDDRGWDRTDREGESAADAIRADTTAQSMPGALSSASSISTTRASICACRWTRSCTASR
jgi:hypothetical protein